MKNATTICIYLFCLLMAGELQAWTFYIDTDSRLRFKYINEENGLTQNSATSILQDKNGLLLFSTYEGLNFYDGYDIQACISYCPEKAIEYGKKSSKKERYYFEKL